MTTPDVADLPFSFSIPLPGGKTFYGLSPHQLVSARFLSKEIFVKGYYGRPGFECSPGDRVIDIGANMGLFALWVSPQVEHGEVVCVEPSSAMDTLQYNLRRNSINNVRAFRCAVGAEAGPLELLEYPEFNGVNHRAGFTPSPWGQFFIRVLHRRKVLPPVRVECECRTLESVLQETQFDRVNLLKIDCEGGEYDILAGASNAVLRHIDRICMEFHEIHKSHDHRILIRRLEEAGFQVTVERPWFDRLFLKTGAIWAVRKERR